MPHLVSAQGILTQECEQALRGFGLRMAGGMTDACLRGGRRGCLSVVPPAQLGDVGHFFKKRSPGIAFPTLLTGSHHHRPESSQGMETGRQHLPEGRAGETLGELPASLPVLASWT